MINFEYRSGSAIGPVDANYESVCIETNLDSVKGSYFLFWTTNIQNGSTSENFKVVKPKYASSNTCVISALVNRGSKDELKRSRASLANIINGI